MQYVAHCTEQKYTNLGKLSHIFVLLSILPVICFQANHWKNCFKSIILSINYVSVHEELTMYQYMKNTVSLKKTNNINYVPVYEEYTKFH